MTGSDGKVIANGTDKGVPRLKARRSAGFESAVHDQRLLVDHHGVPVLVEKVEAPLVWRVGAVPGDLDTDGDPHRLGPWSDDGETTAEDIQLAVGDLGRIGQQHGDPEGRG